MRETRERALRFNDVLWVTGLSRSALKQLERAGQFPAPRLMGDRMIFWLASEVDAWLRARQVRMRPRASGRGEVASMTTA